MGTWNRSFFRKYPYEAFVSGGTDAGTVVAPFTVRGFHFRRSKSGVWCVESVAGI